jgi:16S rRNA processing protein RimM
MNLPQLTEIGIIQRPHGVNGEIQVSWTNNFDPEEYILESVFISIDGIPVPFFIESMRSKGVGSSLVIFEGVKTKDQAQELVNCKVFAEVKKTDIQDELFLDDMEGFTIINTKGIQFGTIILLEDFSGNLVFQVLTSSGKEILIPANPDFIVEVNEDSKTIVMEIPKGLSYL